MSLSRLMTGARPPILYDYYGFPPESYQITWPASGHPELASRVAALLEKAGFVREGVLRPPQACRDSRPTFRRGRGAGAGLGSGQREDDVAGQPGGTVLAIPVRVQLGQYSAD